MPASTWALLSAGDISAWLHQRGCRAINDGMVMDFGDLKRIVNATIIEKVSDAVSRGKDALPIEGGMDHNDLNMLTGIRTTAENLVHWIWDALVVGGIPDDLLYRIRLFETKTGSAEITHAERGEITR